MNAEQLAKLFHETYEELAPRFNYETRKASAKPWEEVPKSNKNLMIAVAERILSIKKKQTAEDCIEDCAVVDDNKYLQISHEKLVEALKKYGDHEPGCVKGDACNCGLEAIIKRTTK